MSLSLWQQCLARLQDELPATEFSMWIRPLQAELSDNTLALYAPNRFVLDWVRDKYLNNINGLLIDDIQFFANKERSQEEFFHTFNALLEGNQQIILTSDRYPKEINGVEDRLKSRFGWGLTVAIEPPELETRVAILMKKADENDIRLPGEVAFFIAKRLRSNVRELEGALNRVIANANFTGRAITIDFVREAVRFPREKVRKSAVNKERELTPECTIITIRPL